MFASDSDELLVISGGRILSNKMLDGKFIRSDRRALTSVKQGTVHSQVAIDRLSADLEAAMDIPGARREACSSTQGQK